jgi:hypothetical protein
LKGFSFILRSVRKKIALLRFPSYYAHGVKRSLLQIGVNRSCIYKLRAECAISEKVYYAEKKQLSV